MHGAKFSSNKKYLSYFAVTGKLKQSPRLDFSAGNNIDLLRLTIYRYSGFSYEELQLGIDVEISIHTPWQSTDRE